MSQNELYHYGVKGMKWGVRRYQNADGSLTDKGIKKYAKKGYAQDSFRSNKTFAGKAFDAYTGAHKQHASVVYDTSSKSKNKARAEKYLAEKEASRKQKKAIANASKPIKKERAAKVVAKGAAIASKLALASAADDIFYGGMGKKVLKETVKQTGRAVTTAFMMANGAYDIRWYDNGILD